eukprot:8928484-Pyramimonas_sp.AAC.1
MDDGFLHWGLGVPPPASLRFRIPTPTHPKYPQTPKRTPHRNPIAAAGDPNSAGRIPAGITLLLAALL